MRPRSISLLFALVALVATVAPAAAQGFGMAPGTPIRWRVLAEGRDGGPARAENRVFYTQADFDSFWRRHFAAAPPGGVDWLREHVVGVFAGTGAAQRVFISGVDRQGSTGLRVLYTDQSPPPRPQPRGERSGGDRPSERPAPTASPYSLIVMERAAGNIAFVRNASPTIGGGRPGWGAVPCTCGRGVWCDGSCGGLYPIPVPWTSYRSGEHSSVAWSGTRYIVDELAWQRYWAELTGDPREPAPLVDFRRDALLAIHLGTRLTGGYGIRVLDVQIPEGWQVVVRYVETAPPMGAFVSQAITSPFVILRLPREAGPPISTKLRGTPMR